MILMKKSPSERPNPKLPEEEPQKNEGNKKWLNRHDATEGVILLGGALIPDFRIRVAQSEMRHDMSPSHWSLCGILFPKGKFASVPLDLTQKTSDIPKSNAIRMCRIEEFDDPKRFPNIAVVQFAKEHKNVGRDIKRLEMDRSILDIPTLILPWLGFIWGTAGSANPLKSGLGLPSAAFVETVFAMAGFELTPGLSSSSSCPEAVWQSARWWNSYYEKTSKDSVSPEAVPMAPEGVFTLRQEFAAPIE
jgi:hypothetical protein